MATQQPLTDYLLLSCTCSLSHSTTHPFLHLAGTGKLPKPLLSQWLSQDRIYAQSYVRFIGLLLSKLRLPHELPPAVAVSGTDETRAFDLLTDSLINIRRELAFFDTVAQEYGLDLTALWPMDDAKCREASRAAEEAGAGADWNEKIRKKRQVMHDEDDEAAISSAAAIAEARAAQPEGSEPSTTRERKVAAATAACRHPAAGPHPGNGNGNGGGDEQQQQDRPMNQWRKSFQRSRSCAGAGSAPGGELKALERGWPVAFGPNPVTKAYVDMFMSVGSSGVTLLEGMVVLWATEYCYLRAWRYAASVKDEAKGENTKEDCDGGAMREQLIPNWASDEFEVFVNRIGDVVDEMAGKVKGVEEGELVRAKCLEWWRQVLWLEEKFWPDIEDLKSILKK